MKIKHRGKAKVNGDNSQIDLLVRGIPCSVRVGLVRMHSDRCGAQFSCNGAWSKHVRISNCNWSETWVRTRASEDGLVSIGVVLKKRSDLDWLGLALPVEIWYSIGCHQDPHEPSARSDLVGLLVARRDSLIERDDRLTGELELALFE